MNNNKNMLRELNQLLSKSSNYYKQLVIKNNLKFDFKKPVILFGAAKLGNVFTRFFKKKGTKILAFSDNNKQIIENIIDGIKIVNKNEIKKLYGKDIQIVATSLLYLEILTDLKKLGFNRIFEQMYFSTLYSKDFDVLIWKNDIKLIINNKKQINLAFDYLSDDKSRRIFFNIIKYRLLLNKNSFKNIKDFESEYFDKKIIHLGDSEVFLDGGAYDGDTTKLIIKESKNRFKNIFAFEPDSKNYKKINNYIKLLKDPRIKIFRLGLGDKNNIFSFTNEGNLQSKVVEYGETQIKIVPIDKFINEHITYIKLDIEGFEKKALIGAKKTIKKYKPKLVICSYHNLNDIWELPMLIKKLRPDYKIFLRHYSDFLMDTICYAT